MKTYIKSVTKFMMSITVCLLVMVVLIPLAYAENDTVSLTYKLDGVICSKPSLKELKVGQSLWVNLAPEADHTPAALSVRIGDDIFEVDVVNGFIDSVVPEKMDPDFSYNPNTYYLLIPGTMVTGNVEINAVAAGPQVVTYLVNQELPEDGSIISSNETREVATGEFVTTFKGEEPYNLTVTMADGMLPFEVNTETGEVVGTGAIKDTDYIKYDTATGELHISNIQANVKISARKAGNMVDVQSSSGKSGMNPIKLICYLSVITILFAEIYRTFLVPDGTSFPAFFSSNSKSRSKGAYKGSH